MTTEFSTELTTLGSEGRPSSGGPAPVRGINIKRLIRLQLLPMMIIAAVIAIPTVALVWLLVPVTFSASAQIQYQVDTPTLIDQETLGRDQLQRFMNDQVLLVTSNTILSRVMMDTAVMRIPWVAESRGDLETLRAAISARILPSTNILRIEVTTDASDHALAILQAVVKEYRSEVLTKKGEESTQILAVYNNDLQSKQDELDAAEEEKNRIRASMDGPVVDGSSGLISSTESFDQKLSDAIKNYETAQIQLQSAETDLEKAQGYLAQVESNPELPVYDFNIETNIMADPTIQNLQSMLAQAESQLALLSDRFQEKAPQLKTAKSERDALRRQLSESQRSVRRSLVKGKIAEAELDKKSAESAVKDAENNKARFEALIEENRSLAKKATRDNYDIQQLDRKQEALRVDMQQIQAQIDDIQRKNRAPARLQLVGEGEANKKPNHGDQIKLSLLCVIAAFGAAGAFGLFREFTDQTVRTPQDLSYVTNLPLLASIPHTSADRLPTEASSTTLAADHAISATADEFRRILTRIIYPPEGAAELNTCLIVSPSRGDGKTSMAANMAIALAQANRRVLLLDISARHPSIEKCFGMEPSEGLSEVLCERANPADLVRVGNLPNLHVMGPGFLREALVGKLASRDVVEFLERAEEEYEHVIIDTPPALLMSDAKLLAPIVDGVIIVCGVGKSSLGMLRRCINDLQNIGANIIGIVLNGIRAQRGGYMRKNVELYYDYPHGRGENGHRPVSKPTGPAASGNGLFPSEVAEDESDELPMIVVVEHPDEGDSDAEARG